MVRKLFILFVLLSVSLMANVGKIVALKGDITIVRDSSELAGKLGSSILQADEILTKENAKAQLLFNDNTVITIGKNAVFKVKEYLFDDSNKAYETNFELLKGTFRTITGKIGKVAPHKFKLNSKTSSIGIRGTQILSRMAVSGDRIACIEGEIIITHLLTGQSIIIKAGEFVDLAIDTKILVPQKLKQKDIEMMDEDTRFTLGDEKEVKLDDLGVVVSEPENVAWGEWNEEAEETIKTSNMGNSQGGVGITNPDVIVNATHTATYTGKIVGAHYDLGNNKIGDYKDNVNNQVSMTVNFGTDQITNGQITADYQGLAGPATDNFTFNGTVNSNGDGFTLNQTTAMNPGTGSGDFYGSDGSIIQGTVNRFMDGGGATPSGYGSGTINLSSD